MFQSAGYEILDYGFTKTPKESIKFDYYYNHESENLFMYMWKKEEKIHHLIFRKIKIPNSINNFTYRS